MGKLLSVAIEYLKDDGWKFEVQPDHNAILTGGMGKHGTYKILINARECHDRLLVLARSPTPVPVDRRLVAAEFLVRANFSLILGGFEMDMDDGEFHYKIAIDVEGGALTPPMVKSMVMTACLMMDKHYPAFMALSYGDLSATEAIQQVSRAKLVVEA